MRSRPLCLAAAAFVFALFFFYFLKLPPFTETESERQAAACMEEEGEVSIIGKTAESKVSEQYATVLMTEAVLVSGNHKYPISSIRVTMNGQVRYGIGTVLLVRGVPEEVQGATNPGQFDSLLWNRVNGIGYVIKRPYLKVLDSRTDAVPEFLARLHESMGRRIQDVFPKDVRGILASMLIGDRSMMW